MTTDEYGRVILSPEDMFQLLYEGRELTDDLLAQTGGEIDRYNDLCRVNDKLEFLIPVVSPKEITAAQEHRERQRTWFMPISYQDMDVWPVLEARCATDAQRARLDEERVEYERRGLLPLLRQLMYLVDEFRAKKVVWGVGRGSSVASFTLYLIGIIKINPMLYGLEIADFLKD